MVELVSRGWARPLNSKKFHFFENGTSLCRKWMYWMPDLDAEDGFGNPENCAACERKRRAQVEAEEQGSDEAE